MNIFSLKKSKIKSRIKYLGWSTIEDRKTKYKRYQELDPNAIYGISEKYDSILDDASTLKKWEENEIL